MPRTLRPLGWLLAAAVPVFVVALGANSIWDHNEAFYVETPRQMVLRGDYVTPFFNGVERLNKPVLSYWIVAGLYQIFGVSVTVERVGIAAGALGIIAAAFFVGRAVRGTSTGVLAALIVATAPRVVMHSRRIFIDVYITLFMSLTLACFVAAERYPRHRRLALLLMYACIGLGVLTKGPIALVLPAIVAAVWYTTERRWAELSRLYLGQGLAVVAAIVLPWYVALYLRHGWGPLSGFFIGENVDRYLNSMVPGDDQRPLFWYVQVLLTDLFPWAPLVVVPLATAWRRRGGHPQAPLVRLLWTWIVVIVGAFSLSATKQDLYIFPVVAATAVLIADWLIDAGLVESRRGVCWALAGLGAVVALCGGVVAYLFSAGAYALAGASTVAAVCVSGGLVVIVSALRSRARLAVFALAGTFIVFNYLFVVQVLPSVERFKPSPAFAEVAATRGEPADRFGSFGYMQSSLVYYGRRPVAILDGPDQLRGFYEHGPAWVMMRRDAFDELAGAIPGLCIASSRPILNARIGDILDQRAPADVVFVTNRCDAAQEETMGQAGQAETRAPVSTR